LAKIGSRTLSLARADQNDRRDEEETVPEGFGCVRRCDRGGGGFSCIEIASGAPVQAPVVDKLTVNVLVDSSHDLFFKPSQVHGVSIDTG
jgi:hypothetical protein